MDTGSDLFFFVKSSGTDVTDVKFDLIVQLSTAV